mgnify:CR=1 FL=1
MVFYLSCTSDEVVKFFEYPDHNVLNIGSKLTDLYITTDSNTLIAADKGNNRVIFIDVSSDAMYIKNTVWVGSEPTSLDMTDDGRYLFVVSLPGAGLDVHRTWEALALGAIVITVHTSLDELLAPYKVVFVNADEPEWWRVLDDQEWLKQAAELGLKGRQLDLSWRFWGQLVRESINRQVVGSN